MKIKRILSLVMVGIMLLASMTAFAAENEVKIELNKFVYAPHEKMKVKISGLTEQQIADGAMVQLAEMGMGDYRTGTYAKVADLKDGEWEPIAPYEVRSFEVRVYTKDEYVAENLLAHELFVIRGVRKLEVVNGLNGISEWAVDEVQLAIFDELTIDSVLKDFQKAITREEFCSLVVNMYENVTETVAQAAADTTFTDTKNEAVLKAYNLGIVQGVGEGKFDCDSAITRQEIATMLFRAVKVIAPEADYAVAEPKVFGDSASVDTWAKEGVDYFASKDIIKGDGTNFLPLDNCKCEEAIVLVKRICESYEK